MSLRELEADGDVKLRLHRKEGTLEIRGKEDGVLQAAERITDTFKVEKVHTHTHKMDPAFCIFGM